MHDQVVLVLSLSCTNIVDIVLLQLSIRNRKKNEYARDREEIFAYFYIFNDPVS